MRNVIAAGLTAMAVLATAAPASATLTQYWLNGLVVGVAPFGDTTGVAALDPVAVRLRYDPARLVDVTAVTNATYGTSYGTVLAAPLTGNGASLRVDVGPLRFTDTDQAFTDLFGAGPHVLFVDSALRLSFFGIKPWAAAFDTAGASLEPFDFVGGSLLVGHPSYFGYLDYGHAYSGGTVPEPASWALLVAGFALAGAGLRRRQSSHATV